MDRVLHTDIDIKDTIHLMTSDDYKERFKAELIQLDIRISKLAGMLSAWDTGDLGFTPTCPYNLLEAQLNAMKTYSYFLRARAEIEGIVL